jgi:hypothetical protein
MKVWQNNEVIVEFDGTEEELRKFIADNKGDFAELNPEWLESNNIIETEEFQDEYEIQSLDVESE